MAISIDVAEDADSKWNTRLLESNLGTIYQTNEFGEYITTIGGKPISSNLLILKAIL